MKRLVLFFSAVAAFTQIPGLASSAEFSCPEKINPNQSFASSPAGWKVFIDKVNTVHRLDHISLYDGPPAELAQLKPDNADTDAPDPVTWSLGTSDCGFYVVCSYSNTSIQLSQRLPKGFKTCKEVGSPATKVACE